MSAIDPKIADLIGKPKRTTTRYTFSHRGDGMYYWNGPRIPGDSRSEVVTCPVEWFWNPRPKAEPEKARQKPQEALVDPASVPLAGVSMRGTWKPGDAVEEVSGGYSGRPQVLRPGTVVGVEDYLLRHERLIIAFDDGETRSINPDVMRHRKEAEK